MGSWSVTMSLNLSAKMSKEKCVRKFLTKIVLLYPKKGAEQLQVSQPERFMIENVLSATEKFVNQLPSRIVGQFLQLFTFVIRSLKPYVKTSQRQKPSTFMRKSVIRSIESSV